MEVLHDWPDKKCGAILSAIRHAAPDNATVLVVEDLMPEEQSDPRGSTLDVIMLTITGGRERTVDQFNLFEGAGRSLLGCLGVSTAGRASSFLRAFALWATCGCCLGPGTATCRTPQFREQLWAWLEAVVAWLVSEYVWDVADAIPAC
jgi:O-methyltransferase domain